MPHTACLLVDDHVMLRDGLALLIAQRHPQLSLQVAGTLREAIDILHGTPSLQLVLLDLSLPDSEGVITLVRLREAVPGARIIVLSADERRETVMAALDAGAAGYIPKTAEWTVMQRALDAVLDGAVFVPDEILRGSYPVDRERGSPAGDQDLGLSLRQMEVLRLLVEGKSNKLIGKELDLAPSTVKTHLSSIFNRLAVNTRTQAVVEAARLGLHLSARRRAGDAT